MTRTPSPSASAVTVACCQLAPRVGHVAGNRQRIREAIYSAADRGANIVVVPELANSGYVFDSAEELRAMAEPIDGETVREWEALASRRRLVIAGGFAELGADGHLYNAGVLIDETGLRAAYRKAHLGNGEKTRGFTPGAAPPPVVDAPYGRIGIMICYDLEFPEWV